MMRAIVIMPFRGCRDGESSPTTFQAGDEIEGDLAAVALREGWAEAPGAPAKRRTRKAGDEIEGDLAAVALREGWAEAPGAPAKRRTRKAGDDA